MGDTKKDPRTLFVRNISFDVADEKPLEELFSDVGPIKSAFLVRDKGATKHKGFGFVTYALQEDADRAAAELNGKALAGRKLQVELANKRAPLIERKRKRPDADAEEHTEPTADEDGKPAGKAPGLAVAAQARGRQPTRGKDADPAATEGEEEGGHVAPKAASAATAKVPRPARTPVATDAAAGPGAPKHAHMRTVALGGLTPETTQQAIALARRAGEVEEVISPAPEGVVERAKLRADGCSGGVVLVQYKTVPDALAAITKLHGQKIRPGKADGGKGKKGKKGGADEGAEATDGAVADTPPVVMWARQVAGESAHVRKWRVIIRNLAFKATEAHLRAAMSKAGFVWELTLPRGPDGRIKGFAFAAFTLRSHAIKAIELVNGTEICGRVVAVDWAMAKNQYEASTRHRSPSPMPGGEDEAEAQAQEHEDEDEDAMEEEDEDEDGEDEGADEEDEDGDEGSAEEDKGEEGEGQEQAMLRGVLAGMLEGEDDEEDAGVKAGEARPRADATTGPKGKQIKGKTAMDVQEEQQQEEDEGEGAEAAEGEQPLEQKGTKQQQQPQPQDRPRNDFIGKTVFVRGLPLDITSIALQAKMEAYGRVRMCRLVMDKASGKPKGTAFVEFQEVAQAKRAADACTRGRQGKGPGVVVGGRAVDVDLALAQDDARSLAATKGDKEGKDKRNLYLAKEGDVPRGSPAWQNMSEHDRQKRERAAEEKRTKLKSPNFVVSATRLSVRNIPYSMTESQLRRLAIEAVKARASKEKPDIKKVKILMDTERPGPDGKPRSKGMGFIEFGDHTHAVACLRQLNNNPTAFNDERRPIIEFAIENVKVLKKLEAIRAKHEENKLNGGRPAKRVRTEDGGGDGSEGGEDGDTEAELTPKQRKRLKAKAKMQRRKERRAAGEGAGGEGAASAVPAAEGDTDAPAASKPGGAPEAGAGKGKGKGKPKGPKPQAGQANGKPGAAPKGGPQGKQQQQGKQAQGRQQRVDAGEETVARQGKRAADRELDALAEGALQGMDGSAAKRRRRVSESEKVDRTDMLAEQYVRKISGIKTAGQQSGRGAAKPQARGEAKEAQRGRKGAAGAAGGKGAAGKVGKATAGKQGDGAKAAAPLAMLDLSGGGSIKRWFDE